MAKPGFGAPDVQTALRQRAEWFEGLGPSAVYDSETLESGSEQWDGEEKEMPEEKTEPKPISLAGSVCDILAAGFLRVEVEELNVKAARERFQTACQAGVPAPLRGRPEPPAARLNRLKKEVSTLAEWASERDKVSNDGHLQQLCREVAEMGHQLVAQDSSTPQSVWLPPEANKLGRVSAAARLASLAEAPTNKAGGYSLAVASSGWLLSSQAELLSKLQARVEALQALLGTPETAVSTAETPPETSLASETAALAKRLQRLEDLSGDACGRLVSSMALLAAQIDVAAAEAQKLEELEREQEKEELELSKPVSPTSKALASEVDAAVETADTQVVRLHEQLAAIDAVCLRAKEMEKQLSAQDTWRQSLELFVQDLALAEARSSKACELLKLTAEAASSMKESSQACTQRLQENLDKLQAKLQKVSG